MDFTGAKVLVTGASGFIGSFIVERALEKGADVWAAVRPTSSRRYLNDPRIHFIELDLGHSDTLHRQLDEHRRRHGAWHYVVHAAGATKCRDAATFHAVNAEGTERLASLLNELHLVEHRFVFISSLSVFGPIRETPVSPVSPYYSPILDTDTPRPDTAYGRSKLAAEQALSHVAGLPYVVLRPTGVYGPRERDYFLMAKSIARHVDFAVGRRPQEITFIYVRDLVEAVFLAFERGTTGTAYFLSDGGVYGSRTFSDLLQSALDVRHVLHITAPVALLRAVCDVSERWARIRGRSATLNSDKFNILKQRNWQCDIAPACRELGYRPRYSLPQGVAETVAWYKEQQWL